MFKKSFVGSIDNPINPSSDLGYIEDSFNTLKNLENKSAFYLDSSSNLKIGEGEDYSAWWEKRIAKDEEILTRIVRGYCNNINPDIIKDELIAEGAIIPDTTNKIESKSILFTDVNNDRTSTEALQGHEDIYGRINTRTSIDSDTITITRNSSLTVNKGIVSKLRAVSYDSTVTSTKELFSSKSLQDLRSFLIVKNSIYIISYKLH